MILLTGRIRADHPDAGREMARRLVQAVEVAIQEGYPKPVSVTRAQDDPEMLEGSLGLISPQIYNRLMELGQRNMALESEVVLLRDALARKGIVRQDSGAPAPA